jgi:antitoxin CptB
MSESSRLKWQCRRGMRELDELLLRYLESRYPDAEIEEKTAFQAILELPDPELNSYLLQGKIPSAEPIAGVIKYILGQAGT